jgi:23S rRNA (guanosine2251-2'-O)-methyltransferase
MNRLPIIFVADNIRSLYNVGSLFRLADGLHVEGLYLCGMTGYPSLGGDDPRPVWVSQRADKEIRKTGLAGVDAVPWRYFETTETAIAELKDQGYMVVGLELTEKSVDYRSTKWKDPVAVVLGHETDGLSAEILAMCDSVVSLPMRGTGKSLNVATSAAAIGYFLLEKWTNTLGRTG